MAHETTLPRMQLRVGAAVAAAVLLAAGVSRADPPVPNDAEIRRSARELGYQGVDAFDNGDWESARSHFHQAYRLVPAPTLALREARSLVKLDRLVEARKLYARVANEPVDESSPKAFRQSIQQAKLELAEVDAIIPRLTVRLADSVVPGCRVFLDGVRQPLAKMQRGLRVDPGAHLLEVHDGEGEALLVRDVRLVRGERRVVVVELLAPADGASIDRTMGWSSLIVGGAGLAVGITTGILAGRYRASRDEACSGGSCPPSAEADSEAYRSLRSVSFVGYGVGVIGVGVGTTLLWTANDDAERGVRSAKRVQPWLGVGSAGIGGAF